MADETHRPNRPLPHHRRPDRSDGAGQHLDLDALGAWLDAGLDEVDRRAVADHLAGCALCRGDLAELRATVALLRGLPQYAPRRSFRLGPEHAGRAARAEGRLLRLLPALPALRAAAFAVAVLLSAVVAGDLVSTSGDDAPDERVSTSRDGAVAEEAAPAAGDAFVAQEEQGDGESPADADLAQDTIVVSGTESVGAASNRVEGPVGAVPEIAPDARRTTAGDSAADTGEVDALPPAAPDAGGDAAGSDGGGPSGWRLAEIALGLLLAGLLGVLLAVRRVNRHPPDPVAPV